MQDREQSAQRVDTLLQGLDSVLPARRYLRANGRTLAEGIPRVVAVELASLSGQVNNGEGQGIMHCLAG
jgi:hypothetical protein